jgi:hypothetical protein
MRMYVGVHSCRDIGRSKVTNSGTLTCTGRVQATNREQGNELNEREIAEDNYHCCWRMLSWGLVCLLTRPGSLLGIQDSSMMSENQE